MKKLSVILLLLFFASTAHAEDRAKARAAFRLGSQHYSLGEYQDALVAFKEAYRNYEDPSFLFNIAQCERQLDQRTDAIRAYRMYLVNAPDAAQPRGGARLIARLEHELAEERATKAAPPPGVQPPPAIVSKGEAGQFRRQAGSRAYVADAHRRAATSSRHTDVQEVVGMDARRHAVAGGAAAGLAVGLTRKSATAPPPPPASARGARSDARPHH